VAEKIDRWKPSMWSVTSRNREVEFVVAPINADLRLIHHPGR